MTFSDKNKVLEKSHLLAATLPATTGLATVHQDSQMVGALLQSAHPPCQPHVNLKFSSNCLESKKQQVRLILIYLTQYIQNIVISTCEPYKIICKLLHVLGFWGFGVLLH